MGRIFVGVTNCVKQAKMRERNGFGRLSVIVCCFFALAACDKKPPAQTAFTKADSLTETYLALQDTMLQVWNTMVHDDNRKIKAMQHLIHELSITNPDDLDELGHYEDRIEDLKAMRYDQHTMKDPEIVSEYDFASNALVSELIAMAESRKEFAYNTTLQKLVDSIRAADQRVNNYREQYDMTVLRFNRFIERHGESLEVIDNDSTRETRPGLDI